MQKKKNIRLLILFLILLIWTVIFINLREDGSRISVDENKFALQDTSLISKIGIFKSTGESIFLEKESGKWQVNKRYVLDPSMKKVLMAVLHQVRVKRTVPKNKIESINEDLQKKGHRIEIIMDDGSRNEFIAGGNGISISYFKYPGEDPLIVFLPGYESYVSGIFDVTENDWRDRLIFQTSWLGLKKLTITYPGNPADNVIIEPEKDLYRVENVFPLDTISLMNFLDQVSYFYTDQYVRSGQVFAYDSLKDTVPYALFNIDAVSLERPLQIRFFPSIPNENVRLGIINDAEMCLFRKDRIDFIFKKRKDFILKPS